MRVSPAIFKLQGTVCTLHEGDDFGKLALINDTPRAATVGLGEDNSQFLRVDKHDFNRCQSARKMTVTIGSLESYET